MIEKKNDDLFQYHFTLDSYFELISRALIIVSMSLHIQRSLAEFDAYIEREELATRIALDHRFIKDFQNCD
jgi:hypothetical protein